MTKLREGVRLINESTDHVEPAEVPQASEEPERPAAKPIHEPVPPHNDEPEDPHERILESLPLNLRLMVADILSRRKMQSLASNYCGSPYSPRGRTVKSTVTQIERVRGHWEKAGIFDWSISAPRQGDSTGRLCDDFMIEIKPPPSYKPPYK